MDISYNNQSSKIQIPDVKRYDFQPYESNGGSIVAVAGDGFAVIAADTRLSSDYTIHTRNQNKLFPLTTKIVLGSTGCWSDTLALTSLVQIRMKMYEQEHMKIMPTEAAAHMLSILMYNRRFFPYYVSNILVGLDIESKGVVYSYDPIGHCEKSMYKASGSAGSLLQPVLDSQLGMKNTVPQKCSPFVEFNKERAVRVVSDAFVSAAERDIYTGDTVAIDIITQDGCERKNQFLTKGSKHSWAEEFMIFTSADQIFNPFVKYVRLRSLQSKNIYINVNAFLTVIVVVVVTVIL
uniref:Proteasome subunit beta n=1 Tax=Glossina palpalis gambiensis TaxID=67801 RepID=A0A1B0BG92_9MUSC